MNCKHLGNGCLAEVLVSEGRQLINAGSCLFSKLINGEITREEFDRLTSGGDSEEGEG